LFCYLHSSRVAGVSYLNLGSGVGLGSGVLVGSVVGAVIAGVSFANSVATAAEGCAQAAKMKKIKNKVRIVEDNFKLLNFI